jgi:OOP family OmpA-OmpF porin
MAEQKNNKKGLIIGGVVLLLLLSGIGYYFYWSRQLDKKTSKTLKEAYDNLQFETGKDVILASSYPSLDELAEYLKKYTSSKLTIEGHTDNQGSAPFNKTLSEKRANAVKNYLTSKGIEESRITTVGYGIEKPIADNTTEEGRAKNRRVEFKITK